MSTRLINALENVRKLPEITLGTIVASIEEEALLVVCLVAILPFMQPIPIPGVSTLLGLIVCLQGIGLMLWSKPLLTDRMKKVTIDHDKFEKIFSAASKFSSFTSKLSAFKHPVINTRGSHIICGLAIALSAAFLSLPLPIPFSNFIPALSIFIICVGLLEEDVILTFIGLGITFVVGLIATFSFHIIKEHISSWF